MNAILRSIITKQLFMGFCPKFQQHSFWHRYPNCVRRTARVIPIYLHVLLLSISTQFRCPCVIIWRSDPLGPLLFFWHFIKIGLQHDVRIQFMVPWRWVSRRWWSHLHDLETVRRVSQTIGLMLNEDKCEIVSDDISVVATVKAVTPSIRHIPSEEVVLLGAPIGDNESVDTILNSSHP